MRFLDAYYGIKPFLPRRFQIHARRKLARRKLERFRETWPIDSRAAGSPEQWQGWPNGKKFALILGHDVDSAKGYSQCHRLMEIESRAGFRSTFYFVPESYRVDPELRARLAEGGFDVGVHGLTHDGKLFRSRKIFAQRALRINSYLKSWGVTGFSSPSMHRNLSWMSELDIEYDISTFDTDPFEPQPEGVRTIFPFWVPNSSKNGGFVELPYTLPQDHCLFIILQEQDNRIWKQKVDWIAEKGGMAFLNTHPDYMNFDNATCALEEYPVRHYEDFLDHIRTRHGSAVWHAKAGEVARFWRNRVLREGPVSRIP